jgi:hypothetical protein
MILFPHYRDKKVRCREDNVRKSTLLVVTLPALLCGLTGVGCNPAGQHLAPVSGVVTLDGRPLANGSVSFQPVAPQGSTIAGKGSAAYCDGQGRFQLETIDGDPGAVVGEHRVRIYGPRSRVDSADDTGGGSAEIVPPKYNFETTLTFTVPAEGSQNANFALTTK